MGPTDDEIDALIASTWNKYVLPAISRTVRAVGYGVCALGLLAANTYPLAGFWSIAIAIGALGGSTASAKFGQIALVVLLFMALVPYTFATSAIASLTQ